MLISRLLTLIVTLLFITNVSAQAISNKPVLEKPKQSGVVAKININKASAQELLNIHGLNASKVRAIITYRKKHGEFKSLNELSQVKGMKRLKPVDMKAIQDQLSL